MKYRFLYITFFLMSSSLLYAQVDDTKSALKKMEDTRQILRDKLKTISAPQKAEHLNKMLHLGLWDEVLAVIQREKDLTETESNLLLANYYWLNNHFQEAQRYNERVLQQDPKNLEALKIKATLLIESWQLQKAGDLCRTLTQQSAEDPSISLILGRALLLQRRYEEALALAKKLQEQNPKLAAAYLLEADVYFWDQQPEKATPFILKALELDPFNADARFSYGYAIWRRVDATQLSQMAAQWELALAINPLHFQTHWHWGNGHTNLTFADYADPQEQEIRGKLEEADSLVRQNQLDRALMLTRHIAQQYPSSVLPLMHEASIYYSDFDHPERSKNLDSAESIFRRVLDQKSHYGPAHNGLSAVIKSKRIPYLSTYDSIKTVLKNLKIKDLKPFRTVFPDVAYYPGDLAKAMVWNQLYTSTVYFPFLAKQGNTFVIPPLHQDLAIAMQRPFFRSSTTFDNRQWMDIRGVGSGAAAIEYVERGAYQERNVILHEYVHLFHGRVLTDQENRRIRSLYYGAMENNRTLDYYSQNNESEYFAQTYPAYFETVKVHPLDFKSMNTQSALLAKDPDMYYFLDSLIRKEKKYLNGDKQAMASNWSQVYINLSKQGKDSSLAAKRLDTAIQYDPSYQPAYLAYAQLQIKQQAWKEAYSHLQAAEDIDPNYAPIYQVYAEWEAQQMEGKTLAEQTASVERQVSLLRKALALESDYQTSAHLATSLRDLYDQQSKIDLAIQAAEEYIQKGSEISTYLRDKKDEAKSYASAQRAVLGDTTQLSILDRLAKRKPQHFELQLTYAQALTANDLFRQSNTVLLQAQKILASNQQRRPDFDLYITQNYLLLQQTDSAASYIQQVIPNKSHLDPEDQQLLVQLLLSLDRTEEAVTLLNDIEEVQTPRYLAIKYYTNGLLQEKHKNIQKAVIAYQQSIHQNPYYKKSYHQLIQLFQQQGNKEAIDQLKDQQASLFAL